MKNIIIVSSKWQEFRFSFLADFINLSLSILYKNKMLTFHPTEWSISCQSCRVLILKFGSMGNLALEWDAVIWVAMSSCILITTWKSNLINYHYLKITLIQKWKVYCLSVQNAWALWVTNLVFLVRYMMQRPLMVQSVSRAFKDNGMIQMSVMQHFCSNFKSNFVQTWISLLKLPDTSLLLRFFSLDDLFL